MAKVPGALVLLALVAMSRRASSGPPPAPRPAPPPPRPGPPLPLPGPTTVPKVNTGFGATWGHDRLAALARAGIDGDVALSILALWDVETGGGKGEWNWNVGNVRPVGSQPRVNLGAVGDFAAYPSLDAGVAAFLALVEGGRYASSWAALQANPTSDAWVRGLGAAGYYEESADQYAKTWAARRAALAKTGVHGVDFLSFVTALRPRQA